MNTVQNLKQDKQHVLHIINDLPYWLMHREPIAAAAVKAGFQVTVASANHEIRHEVLARGYGFQPLPLNRFGLGFKDLQLLVAIKRLILSIKPDIVHLFTLKPLLFGGIVLRSISSSNRPTVVGTVAGLGRGFNLPALPKNLLIWGLIKGLGKVASCLTFENSTDAKVYIDSGIVSASRVKIFMGAGIDLHTFKPNNFSKSKEFVTFLFAARLVRAKGTICFAEAARQLKLKYGSRVRFRMAGIIAPEDPDTVSSDELSAIKNDPSIEWLGEVTLDQMCFLMQETDVFVLPTSYAEGLPRSCLEAGACGATVIAGDVSGVRALIDDNINGIILSDSKLETLVAAMERMIVFSEFIEFGLALRKKIEKGKFGLDIVVKEFLIIYENLVFKEY